MTFGDRSVLPELEAKAYLAYAGIAPVSSPVARAVERFLSDYTRLGHAALYAWIEQRERLRQKLAELIGAQANDVALVSGTTRGISELALCLPWAPGDTVVVLDGDFPANVSPWQNAESLFDLRIRFLPRPDPNADEDAILGPLESALRQGARLLAVSAVQFQSGLRLPLASMARLCHTHGAEISVDGIQACGVVPIDVKDLELDYLVGGAHKWLMGLEGAGFLYARPECARALVPRSAGWLSHEHATRFLMEGPGELRYDRPIRKEIQFLEGSSGSGVGFAALEAGLDSILELTPRAIWQYVNEYLDELESGLSGVLAKFGFTSLRSREPERRSCILSLRPPAHLQAGDIVAELRRRGVIASMPDGLLRFAPHFPNARSEIPTVLGALEESLAALSARTSAVRRPVD